MHATIYVIALSKVKHNGKDRYYLRKNMGKGFHKVFKAVVNYISQALQILSESGS